MRPWIARRFRALPSRNVRLLVSAVTISALGTGMGQVALAFAVLQHGSASDLGFVFVAREIPIVVFLLLGGVWADRVSRKHLLVGGATLLGAAQAATAALFLTDRANVAVIAAIQVVFGVANAFTRPATTGLIAQAVEPGELQTANALVELGPSIMRIAGPGIGAAIIVATNPGWALVADSLSFFLSAALQTRLRIRTGDRAPRRSVLAEVREGWSEFKARSWVWTMVACFGIFQLSLFPAFLVLGPVVAKAHLGGAGAWGAILAVQAAGAAAGGLVGMRLKPRRPLVASSFLMLPTACMLAMLAAAIPVWGLCVAAAVAAVGLTSGDIIWFTTLQRRVPEHLLSRLSSFDWLGSVALNPLGYVLVGPISAAIGVSTTLYAAAALNAIACITAGFSPAIHRLHASESSVAPAAATP